MKLIIRHIYILFGLFIAVGLSAQAEYVMSNQLVRDCEGILTDSEMGPEEGQYDHNEDYTFTICVDQADEIILAFDFFATEDRYDVLTIYDGPDKNSPVLATLSGVVQPPPVVIARSGCVTLHFVSDDNIVANGWLMRWRVEIEEPEIPDLILDGTFDCPLQNGKFKFTLPLDCNLFVPSNFTLVGPGSPSIANVNVLDCDPNDMTATTFELIFNDSLRLPGTYRLSFMGAIQDVCGEWHDVNANVIFTLSNCPILTRIYIIDTACVGDCGRVGVEVIGDMASNYRFNWSHTSDQSQEVDICVTTATVVTVSVINIATNRSTEDQITYEPFPLPVIINPLRGDTFCSSLRDHIYQVTIPGGEYFSSIIPNNQRTTGRYQFWRWSNANGLNRDIVEYYDTNGCAVRDTLFIYPVNAGSIQASCQGGNAFQMNGGSPAGGHWEGSHVSMNGTFDPTTSGSFTVTYVAPNGCRSNKTVNVADSITMPDIDTVCSSKSVDLRDFTEPYGGRWTGPGITNSVVGRLQAWRPTVNQTHRYYYDLNGCIDSIDIYIQELYSGPDLDLCTSADTLFLNYTGSWTGPGTYLPGVNAFDISGLGEGEYVYTLERDGCTDAFKLFIIEPEVEVRKTLEFCLEDEWYNVLDFVNIYPDYGTFTAPTLKDSNDTWYFNPMRLGPGQHVILFEAASCFDSITVDVEGNADIPDYSFCEFDLALELEATPSGGIWSGPGILDGPTGLFDPQVLGIGSHEITYVSPRGCITIDTIEIFAFEEVSINDVEQQYCFKDTVIQINALPIGGELYINGILSTGSFNPVSLGTGIHEVFYTKGSGECQSDDRLFFSVLPPISGVTSVSNDSLCLGDPTVIEIQTSGGFGNLTTTWGSGLGFGNSHIIRPDTSGWYRVNVVDGCSEPLSDSVFVYVYPEFDVTLDQGPEVCYGDTTYVIVNPPNKVDYAVFLENGDQLNDFRLEGLPGFYSLRIVETQSGCIQEQDVVLLGPPPLRANFSIQPNQPCIDIIDNEIDIIDLAVGYTNGYIDFGDGSDTVSLWSSDLSHQYDEVGEYKITQFVVNDLGCTDSISLTICVENKIQYFIPNIFTPNGDGENDEYGIHIFGVTDLEWTIFNRFGGTVFHSTSPDDTWDGTYNGKKLDPAVFTVFISYKDPETGFPYILTRSLTLVK